MMKEHDKAIVTSGFYSRPLLLAISANPVKGFYNSSPLHGTLNFFLWIAEVNSGARTRSTVGATR